MAAVLGVLALAGLGLGVVALVRGQDGGGTSSSGGVSRARVDRLNSRVARLEDRPRTSAAPASGELQDLRQDVDDLQGQVGNQDQGAADAPTADQVSALGDQVSALGDRVDALEQGAGAPTPTTP